ncbi:hypothetical protein LTR99_010278 [Exophiala xenobiotica]|uniref:Nitrogen regulatory protein areA GATA-like domain-containing protein n=1 Tax=Vermiconidia calcicola TaxID=1690605 RepID=A0AAV9Q2L5_9PEZI|nr:hypothetical protein LTR92_007138 [Exophiala xenobiotica]KAK5533997.1 hypothetical protein LTR25_006977 [Vermiconidia calcicola]KAK5534913.1 hypothetical protein LTR23_008588 [Chaetothyriales sp. CCFEE 6169]KAK5263823.1 hypothetical protein LTR96_010798 [Exophiala xenobiotica]KAK5292530.1 hypothetical protein LTR99_010278 [Exophiala xenobiotica]
MTAILPQGLINTTAAVEQNVFGHIDTSADRSDALRLFWRHFAIQSDLSADDACTRSRNLFWRLWSNPELARDMTAPRLMQLWGRCSQAFDMTPIGELRLPWATESQEVPRQARLSSTDEPQPTVETSLPTDRNIPHSLEGFPSLTQETREVQYTLPTLRASGSGQQSERTSGSTSNTTSGSSSRPVLSRTTSGGRSRIPVVATAGRARARPQLGRRKSSSQRTSTVTNAPRSPLAPPDTLRRSLASQNVSTPSESRPSTRRPPPGLPDPLHATSAANFMLPTASSWQSIDSRTATPPLATTAPPQGSSELVERDFRGKFVEARKRLSSFTNLPALSRMSKSKSVVRFADEIPQDEDKGKGKETASNFPVENVDPSALQPSMPGSASTSGDDESSDEAVELTRTKSQLSLLIKHKREQTGSLDLGPEERFGETSGKPKEKDKAKSKEEDLLSMGRKNGVTKAGGVQVPASQRVTGDDPGRFSPSSPEPLF